MKTESEPIAVYRRLFAYLRPHWLVLGASVLASAVYASADSVVPLLLRQVIVHLEQAVRSSAGTRWIPLAIVVLFPVRGAMDFLLVYGLNWVGRSVIRDLRSDLFRHYLALPAAFFDRSASGALISKLTYNTEQVAEAISTAVVVLVRDSLTIALLFGVMLYMSWQLTLGIVVIGPLVGLLVAYMSRAFRRYSARIQNTMGNVTRVAEQMLQAQRIVKIFEGQDYERRQFDKDNRGNFRLNLRLTATRAAGDSLTQFIVALGMAALIFFALSGWLGPGLDAAVFVGFITAMGMVLAPLKRLVKINVAVQRGIAAADSIFAVLDEAAEADSGEAIPGRAEGHVEYQGVSFRYGAHGDPVLRRVDIDVPAGTRLAIVGRSGSGKSTLVNLLARFYPVGEGRILLDGVDIKRLRLADLRRQIGWVGQDVVLFDGSIADNIAYGGLSRCPREQVERAAEAAHIPEFARSLPGGLDARVGERGVLLSGGQRQRIAIARALLKDAPVLVLDEATSALDAESEKAVQAALQHLMRGRTALIIAHRLETVQSADKIVVISDGRVVETGTHADLLAGGGHYAALYRSALAAREASSRVAKPATL
jgi:subfamily B ATP-binding cassette protein MsbA